VFLKDEGWKKEKRRRKQEGRLNSFGCLRIDTVPEKSEGK
jgi:hypothetical protein